MSNIATSNTVANTKNENSAAQVFNPTFLTALQDLSTYFGVELFGSFVQSGKKPLVGDSYKGSFHVKP